MLNYTSFFENVKFIVYEDILLFDFIFNTLSVNKC